MGRHQNPLPGARPAPAGRSSPRCHPVAALQRPNRAGLRGWGSGASCWPREAASRREGGGGGAFLAALALTGNVTSFTQNQAPNAIVFLYGQILRRGFGRLPGIERAKEPARLPVALRAKKIERSWRAWRGSDA